MTTILVVDDSEIDLRLMEGLLKSQYTVVTAKNGMQAINRIAEWSIDIVLTDLQMPQMDGLELVHRIRDGKLEVPVILTTSKGSDEIASRALKAGAAGYIPKSNLSRLLIPTIQNVLQILNSEVSQGGLLGCAKLARYKFELKSEASLIPQVVDFCERRIRSVAAVGRIDCLRVATAVEQALSNAIYRGNLEIDGQHDLCSIGFNSKFQTPMFIQQRFGLQPYKDRTVLIGLTFQPSEFSIRITDQGPGFDTSSHMSTPLSMKSRGLNLMQAFMNVVQFNGKGNEVNMVYRFAAPPKIEKAFVPMHHPSSCRLVCESTRTSHEITQQKFVIGSRPACHLQLEGDEIGPLHCMLVDEHGQMMVLNLSPKIETIVNDKVVNGVALKDGDHLQIGDHAFSFQVLTKVYD